MYRVTSPVKKTFACISMEHEVQDLLKGGLGFAERVLLRR